MTRKCQGKCKSKEEAKEIKFKIKFECSLNETWMHMKSFNLLSFLNIKNIKK